MSLKALEIKIRSTRNLQKITASMKMVASSKMRGVETRLKNARPFFASVQNIYPQTQGEFDEGNNLFPINTEGDHDDYHIQTITSDAGLCGGVNTIACKHTRFGLAALDEAGKTYSLSVVGDRGRSQIGRLYPSYVTNTYDECYKAPFNFANAAAIAGSILDADASKTHLVYNKFQSAVAYETNWFEMENLTKEGALDSKVEGEDGLFENYEFEPENKGEALENLKEFATAAAVFGCVTENSCSEISSKVQAMDNASKNAGEMVDKLQLKYNRARQASITTELIEIISGASALEG